MTRTRIFTIGIALLATGCASFDPNLALDGDTEGDESSGETGDEMGDTGDETGDTGDSGTSTSGPDMGGSEDTGSTDDTGGDGVCGDGMAEGGEECDGDDLLGSTCEDGDFYGGGSVGCTMDCTLDFSACEDLVYEQNFETDTMPPEIELVGEPTAYPFLAKYPLDTVDGNPWGSCFQGQDDWCMQAGPVTHGQASGFKVALDFAAPGEVSSWVWGHTEKFDVLEVQLDGGVECEYSQNFLANYECVIDVDTAGVHQITWVYRKDGGISEGFDTVWVDAITATNAEPL